MIKIREQYLTNNKGKQIGVLLNIRQYHKFLEQAEELDAVRGYDAAKASHERPIAFERVVKDIEQARR